MKRSLLGWILLCILSIVPLSFGQTATTSLRGTVKDPSGALVPGAKVTLINGANGTTFTAVADAAGNYTFAQIPPAKYTIKATAAGFGDQSKIAELLVNQPATINFALTVQAATETVDVSATAQTLNTTDATIGNSVGTDTIEAMPMDGRNPISLLSLQPGALYLGETANLMDKTQAGDLDSRQGSVSGARSDQGNVTLDGVDNNDQINGYAFNGVLRSTLDSTEEFRVTTSNGNADAGRTSGAQLSLVTKSGTNKFHGSLYEYHRPSNMVANDWFVKNEELSETPPRENRPTKYIVNTFGGSAGGPILKDRLFFFFNYEGQRLATNDTVTATTPSATFLQGQLGYSDVNGVTQFLDAKQIAQLDKNCTQCTAPGIDQAMLTYLSIEPPATTLSCGDGINFGCFTFSSPAPSTLNTSIAKIDYTLNRSNHLFYRGNLQKDTAVGDENLPGQPPSSFLEDNTKGMAIGHTWTPTSNIVNDVRYGYTRQGYSSIGIGQGDYVVVRFLTDDAPGGPTAQTRNSIVHVPVHTIDDTLSWTRGNHSMSFGGSWRMIQNETATDNGSYNGANTNPSYLSSKGKPDPTTLGLPAIGQNETAFDQSYATIIGDVAERDASANWLVTSTTTGTLLPDGALVKRHFKANEFEYFLQDAWRIKPNLTITFGLRHTLLQTPYETKGQESAPTVDTRQWYIERGIAAAQGRVDQPDLFFTTAGKANHAPAYWPKQKFNVAPRLAIVYAPTPKTSIRAGYGMYYDHYGEALTSRFSRLGSFGLSSQFQSAANTVNFNTAPRFTGPHDLPNLPVPAAPQTQTYPYAVPDGTFGINWGIDNHIKTPYVQAFNLSIQRELPGGFLLDAAYVGRIGRHLFQQLDIAEPVNYNDPQGAGDYFTAGTQMSKMSDQNAGAFGGLITCSDDTCFDEVPPVAVPTIQYFEDVFPQMKNLDFDGESATEAIYNNEWASQRYTYGETGALADIDFACFYGPPCGVFWDQQFASLIALSSMGNSSYNAGQFTLRRPSQKGLTIDFSYTLSKSIDMGSDAERAATSYGAIQNVWNPRLSRGISDFDTRHLISADWVYALPLGKGKALLSSSGKLGDAIWGGWQWAGLGRWSSGLPFSVIEPGWTTNWELQAYAVTTAKVKTHKHMENGSPQVFADDQAIQNGVFTGSPMRLPYPGEAGQRNNFRSDGVFDIDSSMAKRWNLGERARLKFAWEVYNVTNSARFDAGSYGNAKFGNALTYGGFGVYENTLGTHTFRRMQFGLRVDF